MYVGWKVKNRIICLENLYRGCTFQKSIYTYIYPTMGSALSPDSPWHFVALEALPIKQIQYKKVYLSYVSRNDT